MIHRYHHSNLRSYTMNPENANTYSALLHAEFFGESHSSLCEDYEVLDLSLSCLGKETQEDNLFEEMDTLMEGNERAERALMKFDASQVLHYGAKDDPPATGRTPIRQGRPRLSHKSLSLHYLGDQESHKGLVGIGQGQRRRSVGGAAA